MVNYLQFLYDKIREDDDNVASCTKGCYSGAWFVLLAASGQFACIEAARHLFTSVIGAAFVRFFVFWFGHSTQHCAGGGPFMLFVFLFGFVPAFLMRWRIPVQAKHLTKCWPVICFLLGVSYQLEAWNWLECDWYLPFYLWMLPALAGLAIGKLAQR